MDQAEKTPCRVCGEGFRWYKGKPGRKDVCRDCGREEEAGEGIRRAVGLQGGGGKHSGATIFRNPTEGLARLVNRMNRGGFNANNGLYIGSTTSTFEPGGKDE